jgi:hypothetical protein
VNDDGSRNTVNVRRATVRVVPLHEKQESSQSSRSRQVQKKKKLSQTHISPVLQLACDRELVGVGPSGRDWALRHAGGPVRPIRAILDNAVEMNRRRLVEEVRDVHQDEIACIELHLSAC